MEFTLYTGKKPDLIYIGLSSKIERRFSSHKYLLSIGKHENYKVQDCYKKHGDPAFLVLEECGILELNTKEVYWISKYNSIVNGLNIIEGGGHSYGLHHTTSKYSKFQILKVFLLLAKTDKSFTEIAYRTKVPKTTVASIASGRTHTWLQELDLTLYALVIRDRELIANKNRVISKMEKGSGKYLYIFYSPTGECFNNTSISNFIRTIPDLAVKEQATKQGFSKIIHGHIYTYMGWKVERHEI